MAPQCQLMSALLPVLQLLVHTPTVAVNLAAEDERVRDASYATSSVYGFGHAAYYDNDPTELRRVASQRGAISETHAAIHD